MLCTYPCIWIFARLISTAPLTSCLQYWLKYTQACTHVHRQRKESIDKLYASMHAVHICIFIAVHVRFATYINSTKEHNAETWPKARWKLRKPIHHVQECGLWTIAHMQKYCISAYCVSHSTMHSACWRVVGGDLKEHNEGIWPKGRWKLR